MAAPLLSVITASRDRPELLARKLDSLIRQTLQPELFEWIVCLDQDSGESRQALEAAVTAAVPLFQVQVLDNPGRPGPGPARNHAASAAASRILYFSDDDCLPDPGTLRAHVAAQRQPAVYLGAIRFADSRRPWLPRRPDWWNVNGANMGVPAASFVQAGGFPDYLLGYGGEDLGLGYALGQLGLEVSPLSGAAVTHLGPATGRGNNPDRWHQAGANAARLAARHPGMAARLGVSPWQLVLKRLAAPFIGRFERGYLNGALAARREEVT